ncbi:MAG: glycosyltransferase family 2 protein [Pseudomonadota bacterium]
MPKISVIIVNYNTAALTIEAANSVLALCAPHHDLDIHIVENASGQDDAARLLEMARTPAWAERVIIYPETTNHGFGRGNNVALNALAARETPPEFVFLLNPDAMMKNDAIGAMRAFMDRHPKAAIAGARAYKPGEDTPESAAFRFHSVFSVFSSALAIGPWTRLFAHRKVVLDADIDTQKVDWVSGAAVFARFEVLREIGFFDPEYFLYFEEVDLMRAATKAGWECWHVAEAEIIHIQGAVTGVKSSYRGKPRRPAYWYQSWSYYFLKNHGRGYALACAAAWVAGAVLNRIVSIIWRKGYSTPQRFFHDFWAMAIRPLLGLSARPY